MTKNDWSWQKRVEVGFERALKRNWKEFCLFRTVLRAGWNFTNLTSSCLLSFSNLQSFILIASIVWQLFLSRTQWCPNCPRSSLSSCTFSGCLLSSTSRRQIRLGSLSCIGHGVDGTMQCLKRFAWKWYRLDKSFNILFIKQEKVKMSENVTAIARLLSGLTHYSTRPHLVTHFVLLFQLPIFRVWLNSLRANLPKNSIQ